jgi:hypothetical protein
MNTINRTSLDMEALSGGAIIVTEATAYDTINSTKAMDNAERGTQLHVSSRPRRGRGGSAEALRAKAVVGASSSLLAVVRSDG